MGVLKKAAVVLASVGAVLAGEPEMPGSGAGPLEIHAASLRRMFRLSWKGESLVLDRSIWQEAEKDKDLMCLQDSKLEAYIKCVLSVGGARGAVLLCYDLARRVGGSSFGSWSGAGEGVGFPGKLEGLLRFRNGGMIAFFREAEAPGRMIELFDDGQGALRIVLTDAEAKDVVFYNQAPDGRFNLGLCRGGRAEALSGTAFGTLCRERPDLGDGALFPLLDRLGIAPPLSPCHPEVVRAVCAALRPLAESEVQSLIRQLDHADLSKREEATLLLSEHGFVLKESLRKAADEPGTPPEAKDRLRQILDAGGNPRVAEVVRFVADSGILKDPAMLARVLSKAAGPDHELIAKAIDAMGEKTPVPAPSLRQPGASAGPLPPLPVGALQRVSEQIGGMLAFVFREGALRLDRDRWDEPFRGKSETELQEMFIKQSRLPKWVEDLVIQGEDKAVMKGAWEGPKAVAFGKWLKVKGAVAHFDRLAESLTRMPPRVSGFINKYVRGGGLDASLLVNGPAGENYVHLALCEEAAPSRVLDCHDDGSGRLRVYAASPGLDGDAFFFQGSGGRFVLFSFRGGKPRALAGEKLQPLCEQNREWIDPEFFGTLRHLGVLTPGLRGDKGEAR